MSRESKQQFVEEMRHELQRAAGVLFVDYTGLRVAQADALRIKMRAAQVTYRVVKNTLMARAVEGTSFAAAVKYFKGTPTGVVLGFEDPVTAAKLTYEFAKDNEQVRVKGGIVDSRAIAADEAEALSKLPSRTELQAAVVALAQSPGANLAAQLKAPAGRLLGAVEALAKRLEEAAA